MEKNKMPGLTLSILQAPYIPHVVGYGISDAQQRRIAEDFGDLFSTNYDDERLSLLKEQYSTAKTVERLKAELTKRQIQFFA